jgi:hypothetical protein
MRLLPVLLLALASGVASLSAESLGNFKGSGFTYGYEKWQNLGATQRIDKDGTTILGPADGGAGLYLHGGLDVKAIAALEVTIRLAPGNTAGSVLLKIPNVQEWSIDLAKLSADKFTTLRFPVGDAAREKGGEVKNVQLQGTFTPGQTVGVTIQSITVVPAK